MYEYIYVLIRLYKNVDKTQVNRERNYLQITVYRKAFLFRKFEAFRKISVTKASLSRTKYDFLKLFATKFYITLINFT